jgi:multiple sugar transport system permease protein
MMRSVPRTGALAAPVAGSVAHRPSLRRARLALRSAPVYIALIAGAVVMLVPFAWMVSTSLQPDSALGGDPQLIPANPTLDNYGRIAEAFPFWRFLANSLVVAATSTVLQVFTSAMGAYAFARLVFRGRDALFVVYLATLMVPLQVTIVPLFVEMRYLGLVNTYPGLILPAVASAFGTFLLRQAFLGLPRDLDEAAFMDGASHWTVFRRILLPLVGPALATFTVFAFMASWNSFLWPLVVTSAPDLMTLPVGLSALQGRYETAWNLVMAGATVSVIPILLIYAVAQRHVVRGVAFSGIKG